MSDLVNGEDKNKSNHNSVVTFPAKNDKNTLRYSEYPPVEGVFVEDEEINLKDLWQVLVRRRWVVLIIFLVVLSATIITTFLATPVYRASLTLQINRDMPKVLEYQEITPGESVQEKDFYQTQYELLKSRSLAQRVIGQLGLKNHKLFKSNSDVNSLANTGNNHSLKENVTKIPRKIVDRYLSNLTIEPIKRSRLVKIHYDSSDPALATKISNAIASNFINLNLERRFDAASYAKTFIEDRLRQVKASLEDSERELVKFSRENEIINIENSQPIVVKQLGQVNTALSKAEQMRIKAEALYHEMLENKGQGLNAILNSSVIQNLKHLKTELDTEYQEKLNIYKPTYPGMIQLKNRINEVQAKLNVEIGHIRSAIYSDFNKQKKEEQILLSKLTELKEQVLELQDRSIQYRVLKRETDTNKQLYQGLLQRMKEVGVAGGISTNNIAIIDKAEVPINKFKPNLMTNTLLAVVFGLIAGVFLAFFFEYFDDTIKSPSDMEKLASLSTLGIIPAKKRLHTHLVQTDYDVGLLSHYEPRSIIAESYRSARTALQFSTSSGMPKVLLVTSSSPGEGKTTSALNIAVTFSQMGKTVLLIDTDLRNPSIHNILGLENNLGLTNYLAGTSKPLDITLHTFVPRLFTIPTGPLPPNPAELLNGDKMENLLVKAKEKFDFIVLDGPPIMGLADAIVLASIADGTAVVVESGSTRHEHLQNALKRLQIAGITIVGGILSKYSPNDSAYNSYQNYYYYSRDEEAGDAKELAEGLPSSHQKLSS